MCFKLLDRLYSIFLLRLLKVVLLVSVVGSSPNSDLLIVAWLVYGLIISRLFFCATADLIVSFIDVLSCALESSNDLFNFDAVSWSYLTLRASFIQCSFLTIAACASYSLLSYNGLTSFLLVLVSSDAESSAPSSPVEFTVPYSSCGLNTLAGMSTCCSSAFTDDVSS